MSVRDTGELPLNACCDMIARLFAAALAAACAGCQGYTALRLPRTAPLAASLGQLDTGGVDIARPLTIAAIGVLAVANSPDLRAARSQRGVGQAQLLQARVLPNPSVSGTLLPLIAGPAAANPHGQSVLGWNGGLAWDVQGLITHHQAVRAAAASAQAVDAALLWQEWQTVAQARLLAVDIMDGDRLRGLLRQSRDGLAARAGAGRRAIAQGNAVLTDIAPDIAAAAAAQTALDDQERAQMSRRHQLNALLGLAPDVALTLSAAPDLPPVDPAQVRALLPGLAGRRPDLVALRYGYAAEDAKLRAAILAQFPRLTIGVTGGSDNSNVRTIGPQITLDLPVFDRNQGAIAVETATRAQLHAEYAARLAAAVGQIGASLSEIAQTQDQLAALRPTLAPLQRAAAEAAAAAAHGDLDERSALDLRLAPVVRAEEIVTLEQTLAEQVVTVATLTGAGLPPLRPFAESGE